jgi:hypothetical protein
LIIIIIILIILIIIIILIILIIIVIIIIMSKCASLLSYHRAMQPSHRYVSPVWSWLSPLAFNAFLWRRLNTSASGG